MGLWNGHHHRGIHLHHHHPFHLQAVRNSQKSCHTRSPNKSAQTVSETAATSTTTAVCGSSPPLSPQSFRRRLRLLSRPLRADFLGVASPVFDLPGWMKQGVDTSAVIYCYMLKSLPYWPLRPSAWSRRTSTCMWHLLVCVCVCVRIHFISVIISVCLCVWILNCPTLGSSRFIELFVPGLHLEAVSGCARGAHAEAANAHLAAHQGADGAGGPPAWTPKKLRMLGSLGGEKKKDRILNRNIKLWHKVVTFDFWSICPIRWIYTLYEYHADLMPKPSHTSWGSKNMPNSSDDKGRRGGLWLRSLGSLLLLRGRLREASSQQGHLPQSQRASWNDLNPLVN